MIEGWDGGRKEARIAGDTKERTDGKTEGGKDKRMKG
jgi:hypothetical protein